MKQNSEWISISDMMSGLMLIFLFICIIFMLQVNIDKDKIKDIALLYAKSKKSLNQALHKEFDNDLKKWNAQILQDNSIVFNQPNVLFESGKSNLKNKFKKILDNFFPRYIKILTSKEYKNSIDEIRIEGHTSNEWLNAKNNKDIYLKNMKLSQERAFSVLKYVYNLQSFIVKKHRKWLEKKLRANGMSYAKLKYLDPNKTKVDKIHSRRVEFKSKLKSEEKIYKILKALE